MSPVAAEITIISSEQETTQDKRTVDQDSRQQPVWHVIVLGILTLSIYLVYWAYRIWRDLKRESADESRLAEHPALNAFKDINPGLRMVALLSPIIVWLVPLLDWRIKAVIGNGIEIYVLGTLVIAVAALDPDKRDFAPRHPLLACLCVLGAYLAGRSLSNLNGAFFLVGQVSVIPFGFVQHWLNKYWRSIEPDELLVRHGFNLWEMIAIISGASLIGLVTAGTMIGVK